MRLGDECRCFLVCGQQLPRTLPHFLNVGPLEPCLTHRWLLRRDDSHLNLKEVLLPSLEVTNPRPGRYQSLWRA